MGVMDVPVFASSILFKIPAFGALFYTFNCATFGLSLMDSMMPLMLGTTADMMPIVTNPVVDALFMGYAVGCHPPQTRVPARAVHAFDACADHADHAAVLLPQVVNVAIAMLVYPMSFMNQETVKFQQLGAAVFYIGFLPIMYLMLQAGMMGMQGVAMYVVMNGALGVVSVVNYMAL